MSFVSWPQADWSSWGLLWRLAQGETHLLVCLLQLHLCVIPLLIHCLDLGMKLFAQLLGGKAKRDVDC